MAYNKKNSNSLNPSARRNKRVRNSSKFENRARSSKTQKLKINLSFCKYPIIKQIAKEDFDMRISKNANANDFDIFWGDTVNFILMIVFELRGEEGVRIVAKS